MEIIGKARFKNLSGYLAWHETVTKEHTQELWSTVIYQQQNTLGEAFRNIYGHSNSDWGKTWNSWARDRFMKFANYLERADLPWDVRYIDPDARFIVISFGQLQTETSPGKAVPNRANQFLIENWQEYLEYQPFVDHSEATIAELRQLRLNGGTNELTGRNSLIPWSTDAEMSVASVQRGIGEKKEELAKLQAKIKAVEEGETEELRPIKQQMEALKAQMDALKEQAMKDLNALKAELDAKVAEMNKQIFVLDSEIYSIRCFLGEAVSFRKLRSGKNAPLEHPVVLYQKMRFALEDLGKFSIMWPNEKLGDSLEDALATSNRLMDAFAPSKKCISLIRYSKTGTKIAASEEVRNALDIYELVHGNQIAILIRNGENLYMGWTDEERISLHDDFFLKPTEVKEEPLDNRQREGESDWDYRNRMELSEHLRKATAERNLKEGLSRYFLFSILNGIAAAENSILPLPKFANAHERDRHIIYSMADGTLTDNRFGSFGEIIARCNATVKKGDSVLMTLHLRPEPSPNKHSQSYHNDRGRGEKNRTHDVSTQDCTIYPINLVEFDQPRTRYLCRVKKSIVLRGEDEYFIRTYEGYNKPKDAEVLETTEYIRQHNFISLEKGVPWYRYDEPGAKPARANFEVFTSEFINLVFMNSCWLNYVLSTQNVSGWEVAGTDVDYAYALRYLSKALRFVKKREEKECANILLVGGSHIIDNPDWPVALSEWKMEHGVRELTEYQAKRFVKAMDKIGVSIKRRPMKMLEGNIELLESEPWC